MTYHNGARTHLSLDKDAPIPREVQGDGRRFVLPDWARSTDTRSWGHRWRSGPLALWRFRKVAESAA